MLLVSDSKLPSLVKLRETLPPEVFVSPQKGERVLRVGILNLMPTAVCERTEMQFMRLLARASRIVEPVFIYFDTYKSNSNQEHFDAFYKKIADVKKDGLDGLIVTGANLEQFAFEEVKYWNEFVPFIDWARDHVTSTIFSCWAMHAALYHYYGIEPTKHEKKQFGVFLHTVHHDSGSPLLLGLDDHVFLPHSRWRGEDKKEIETHEELKVLMENEDVGPHLIVGRGGREVYVQGHPEYDRDDIAGEYFRDKEKGIAINLPCNYFPNDDDSRTAVQTWAANGQVFYTNWVEWMYATSGK